MALYGGLDASKHFDEFDDPIETQEGTLSSAVRKARALANLGVTATAAELNAMDGVTASAAEINLLDGSAATNNVASVAPVLDAGKGLRLVGPLTQGTVANVADVASVKGIYMNPAVVAVAVPTIANDAAENGDSVAVDVAAAFTVGVAVGDAVIAIPMEALPTDCLLAGAYVSATDTITVSFISKEGGAGVTGANVNFNFLLIDLT